ncbi:hypothetical protein F4677DRAFT_451255 [Hypoxylon crocopeplum]|nr:hypothetical protein F4677DRAFT_451255 [Hypoxylon crocopeplum]
MTSINSSTYTIRYGLSGFGPRNAILVKDVVVALLAEREMVHELNFRLDFHIFEQNGNANDAGSGHAFQTDCDATLNSSISGAIPFTNSHRVPGQYEHIVSAANDLGSAVAEELEADLTRYEAEYRQRNPAAYALLRKATDKSGRVNTSSRAFATRGLLGKVQGATIRTILEFAEKEVPEIQIKVYYGHTVVGADFYTPKKPKLLVRNNESMAEQSFEFDFVQLANGTTGKIPVSDDVASKAFSSTPNIDAIRSFLDEHGVLDTAGLVKQGSRIGITGMRLGAYDSIPLILKLTNILLITDNGWELDEREAMKYQGLFTFISSHEGNVAPPRHAHTMHWPGILPFLNTQELHTIMLQQDFDWLSFVMPILKANVAAETGTLPSQVNRPMTTEQRMANYHQQNIQYRRNMVTEAGLLRAGKMAMVEGFGFESDPEIADQNLVLIAPITRRDRAGFSFRYSCAYDITQPTVARNTSNADFFKHWGPLCALLNASPVAIHDMVARLFGLGVARFVEGSFEDIKLKSENQKVSIRDHDFDVLFAPKVLMPTADVLLQSLRGKVKEIAPGVPDYIKGRFMYDINGEIIHAIDVGSGGHGTTETLPGGSKTVVGLQWADTRNHLSAGQWAATASRTLLLLGALKAKGCDTPAEEILTAYIDTLPSQYDYEAEVTSLEATWKEINERSCFLRVLGWHFSRLSDWASYAIYSAQCVDRDLREGCIDALEKMQPLFRGFYNAELAKVPPFKPVTRDHFFLRRHLDFTPIEMERVWKRLENWSVGSIIYDPPSD